jgi:hypothetical protein
MLRNRSRTTVGDHIQSPTQNQTRQNSSFFGSPRFFTGFLENSMSPTSTLDNKQFSSLLNNPFDNDQESTKPITTFPENKHSFEKLESQGIGLAILDSLVDENKDDDSSLTKHNSRMVVFGSNLKIQIPDHSSSSSNSPESPADFGIKTRNSQILSTSPAFTRVGSIKDSTMLSLSMSEIELSEEYTCVISHGPNPRTTHIYDNCIVQTSTGCCSDEYDFSKNLEEICKPRARDDQK